MSIFTATALSAAAALPPAEHTSRRTSSVRNGKADVKPRDSFHRNGSSFRSSTGIDSRRTSYDSASYSKHRRRSVSHTRSMSSTSEKPKSDLKSAEDVEESYNDEDDDEDETMFTQNSASEDSLPPALQVYEHQLANCGDDASKRGATHFTLGWLYFHGSAGVSVDHVRANSHFVAAADCGDALAAYYVGLILEEDGESLLALDAFVHAAHEGCSAAMLSAGRIILAAHAQGVGKFTGFSKSDGMEWIRKGTSGDVSRRLF